MPTISVAEHAAITVELASEVAAAIHAGGHLTVSPLGHGRYRLKAAHRVGVLRYGELELRIVPKVPIGRLLHLAAHGGLDGAWSDLETRLSGVDDPRSALAHVMIWHAQKALAPTPLQGYRTEESAERHLRGRVLFDRQIARRAGVTIPVELRFDEYDRDIVENRVLLAALRRVEPLVDDASLSCTLARLRRKLDGVTPWPSGRRVPEIPWTRLNRRYRAAIRLARLVLERQSLEFDEGSVDGRGFLIDMHRVFEAWLTAALSETMTGFGGDLRAQHPTALDEADTISMYPDITWWRDGRCRAVIDAKYKRVQNASYPNADAYQMLAYCTRLGLGEGWLVYAALEGSPEPSRVIRNAGRPARRYGVSEAPQHDVPGDGIERQVTAAGQEGEVGLRLLLHLAARAAEQRTEAVIEPELASVLTDEVEHGAETLAVVVAKPPAELLQEQGAALGGAQHQQGVHARHVHALVEEIHREEHTDVAGGELSQCRVPLLARRVGPDGGRGQSGLGEDPGHEPGMRDADAEPEGAHGPYVGHVAAKRIEHTTCDGVVRRQHVRESIDIVATATAPGHLPQIGSVGNAEVGERYEPLLLDRVPEPELGRDPTVEPIQHRDAVSPFRGRGETEQFDRCDVIEEPPPRVGTGMVKLVDDDDLEAGRRESLQRLRSQGLYGGEHVFEESRLEATDPQFAERRIAERVAERCERL